MARTDLEERVSLGDMAPMTVAELIDMLQQYEPDRIVCYPDKEDWWWACEIHSVYPSIRKLGIATKNPIEQTILVLCTGTESI